MTGCFVPPILELFFSDNGRPITPAAYRPTDELQVQRIRRGNYFYGSLKAESIDIINTSLQYLAASVQTQRNNQLH